MNWTDIRPAIKTMIGAVSGIPTLWKDEPRPFGDTFCLLSVTASSGIGSDEMRIDQDLAQTNEEIGEVWIGNRNFTITVTCQTPIQTDSGNAYQYLEHIRDRYVFKDHRQAMRDVNCTIVGIERAIDHGAPFDDRAESVASIDIRFAARNIEVDPSRYGYIATVETDNPGLVLT